MLTIAKKTMAVGSHINVRTEKHGDEDVIACDIGIMFMDQRELANTLLGDGAVDAFWRKTEHGLTEPRFPRMGAIALAEKIESCRVEIWPRGLDEDSIKFGDANLSRVRLTPQPGGVVKITTTLQCKPEGDDYTTLVDCLNRDVEIAIECKGFGAQQSLPLDNAA